MEVKKEALDKAITSLEETKKNIKEDSFRRLEEGLKKDYPEATSFEEAMEQWLKDPL